MTPSIKIVVAPRLQPKEVPDGTSLEEQVNAFLAAFDPSNVLDLKLHITSFYEHLMIVTYRS